MALDLHPEFGEAVHLLVCQYRSGRGLPFEAPLDRPAFLARLDDQLLGPNLTLDGRKSFLVDDVAIRRHRAADDGFAETEGSLDDQFGRVPRRWIDCEHHAGARRSKLPLDDHGDVHVDLTEATLSAVEDRARAEQRAPALADRLEHDVVAADVQEGLVHPGERGGLGVLRSRRRADGDRDVFVALAELAVALHDHLSEIVGDRLREYEGSGAPRGELERVRVVDIEVGELRAKALAQPRARAEVRVGGRADHEARRDRQTGRRQLSEVGALPAREGGVVRAELGERANC